MCIRDRYQEAEFEKESFDLVTLFQVLEHLADPVEDIRSMSEFLKPDGLFVIEVPDILFLRGCGLITSGMTATSTALTG